MNKHKHYSLLLIYILFFIKVSGQVIIQGNIKDTASKAVSGAIVSIYAQNHVNPIKYTFSNDSGNFRVNINAIDSGVFLLEIKALNFISYKKDIVFSKTSILKVDVVLNNNPSILTEVIVQNNQPITRKKDTLNYDVASFSSKFDRVVGDILQKLPGLEVSGDGTIRYEGKAINKFYIDGKDLLDGKYSIATSNLPSSAIDKIQILERHQPNKILDSFVTSTRAAINLVLKDSVKNKLLGKVKLGAGVPLPSTDNEIVPLFFSASKQAIGTLKYNNIGKDYSSEFKNLYPTESAGSFSNIESYLDIININKPFSYDINLDKFLQNDQLSGSLNQLVSKKKNVDYRLLLDFAKDAEELTGLTRNELFYVNDTFRISENNNYFKSRFKVNTTFSVNKTRDSKSFSNFLRFRLQNNTINSLLTNSINPLSISQKLLANTLSASNTLKYNFKKGRQLNQLAFQFSYNSAPQELIVQNGNYDTLFTTPQRPSKVRQSLYSSIVVAGLNYNYFLKLNKYLSISNNLNFDLTYQPLSSELFANINDTALSVKSGFRNDSKFIQTIIANNFSLNFSRQNSTLSASLPLTYISLGVKGHSLTKSLMSDFLPAYSLAYSHKVNRNLNFYSSLSNLYEFMPPFNASNNFILNNYRLLSNNSSLPFFFRNSQFESALNYKNILKLRFVTFGYSHSAGQTNPIRDNYFINDLTIRNAIAGSLNQVSNTLYINYSMYKAKLKTSMSLQSSLTFSESESFSRGVLTNFENTSFQLILKTNSNLKKAIVDNKLRYSSNMNKLKGEAVGNFSLIEDNLNIKIPIDENIFLTSSTTYSSILRKNESRINFLFSDATLTYSLPIYRIDFELNCQNIFNQKTFTDFRFYGNTQSINQIQLRPRQFLIKISLYF